MKKSRAHEEFERFAAAHADGLIRTAYLMVGDRGDAEDIVQECMLRLARKWPRVRRMDHRGAYARKVMVSLVLDGRQQRARRTIELTTLGPESGTGGAPGTAITIDARADLIRALHALPERPRAVIVLRYFSDLPETEVATILGCSVGTVKSSASRALSRLRLTLEEPTPDKHDVPEQPAPRRTLR